MKSISGTHHWVTMGLAAALVALPVQAAELRQSPKAVLELFTSQGCNSCPKADALLTELSKRKDLITLAYHVDYWDYVGWKDTFGSTENSDLQRAYAKSWGSSRIFTPQLVVNGQSGVLGSRQKDVAAALEGAHLSLPVTLALNNDVLEIGAEGVAGGREAMVWLVTYKDAAKVAIESGENAGATMNYTSIVTGKQVLGMWEPGSGAHLKLPLKELLADGSNGLVILIQQDINGLPGPILGAASIQL